MLLPNRALVLGCAALLGLSFVAFHTWPLQHFELAESRFAYAQYATNLEYLCNAAINFARLKRYNVKHDMVLIYPAHWASNEIEAAALESFRLKYSFVTLCPFEMLSTSKGDAFWHDSLTKLNVFALDEYTRVLYFDSDSLVFKNLDELFSLPSTSLAVPRAYWLTDPGDGLEPLASHVMLLEPNESLFQRILDEAVRTGDFDMNVINHVFSGFAMVLPHRGLALLTGEFRRTQHRRYLAPGEKWNAQMEIENAKLVHFSDWPLAKPWKIYGDVKLKEAAPACQDNDCSDRNVWEGIYKTYGNERAGECGFIDASSS